MESLVNNIPEEGDREPTYNINNNSCYNGSCTWDQNINMDSNNLQDNVNPISKSQSYFNKNSTIETRYCSKLKKYYFNIEDIFKYITLGKSFSNEYYDIINNHVCNIVYDCDIKSLSNENKIVKDDYSFNGKLYDKTIVMYTLKEYNMVSYALLDWAIHNPEKIA